VPYGGTTGERLKAFALNADTRERIGVLADRYWEAAAYGLIGIIAAVMRFYNLGARAMHHDESLHGFFSWGFKNGLDEFFTFGTANTDTYKHVPFMHGPFQFIGNGFMMWIFGDGDYQARILAATMGTGLVLLPLLLRKQLGRFGALAAAAFIAISPTLLYYSRFTREDIYTAFWTLGMVVFAWRYMTSRQNKWLYLTVGFMAGSFLTKETTFMTAAAFIFFFMFLFAGHIADKVRATRLEMSHVQYVALTVGLIPAAPFIAIGWPFIQGWREKYALGEMPPEADLIVAMGSLALPMYAAGVQLLPNLGKEWRNRSQDSGNYHIADPEFKVAMASVFSFIALSFAIGLSWRPKVWAIAAACFWVPFILLSTTFFSNPAGFFSVIWGSLDYWLSQQDVRRGNQPDYYYFITIPVYEFLPLVLSIAGGLYYAIRGKMRSAYVVAGGMLAILILLLLPPGPDIQKVSSLHIVLPFTLALIGVFSFDMDRLNRFLMFWLVVTSFALTVAGEKMPWLTVHIALPLAVLAGRFVGDMMERTDLRPELPKLDRLAPFAYAAVASALSVLVFVIVGPFSLASTGGWILAIVAGVAVYWAYTGYSRKTAAQVAILGAVCALSVFSVRAAVLASYGHPGLPQAELGDLAKRDYGDVPDELLVYTQTSGDIPVLRDQIDKAARDSNLGKNLPIVVDSVDGYTWPWAWYLRDYKSVSYTTISPNYTPPQGAVLLISKGSATNVNLGTAYNEGVPYHHRRWFPEEYRGADGKYSSRDFFRGLFSKSELSMWLGYWIRRTPPNELGTVDGVAFFPKGLSDLTAAPAGPTVRTDGTQLVIGGNGSAKGQMSGPSDVAIDSAGNLYVADTNNNRVEKYDAQGNFVAVAGGFGSDLQLNQPWSMTVAPDGTVFVADTWNHKLVKLDKDLKKVKEWGAGGQTDAGGDPMKLFGPRDIALSPDGHVLIVDTGNNRVIEYDSDGNFVRQFGSKGTSGDPLQFNEPSSLAVAANGDIFVADFWNKRIVHLDKDLKSKGEIKVDSWGSQAVTDRGYIALLADGRLLATDPSRGKVLAFGADGAPIATYDMPKEGSQLLARPIGIATDGTSVLVTDSIGNVARKIPLSEIIK
jgi:uncharacterized protein (TIGR03663 family)